MEEEIINSIAGGETPDVAVTENADGQAPEADRLVRKDAVRDAEIQKYIDSLEGKELYDPDSYEVHLENFDGPLDLLWFLVRRSKININDIFLSEITEQYLATMSQVDNLDLERASEFIEVAACLIEIKSREILPRPPVDEDPEDDPKAALIRRMEEYRLLKEASAKIKPLETTGQHYREPDPSVGKPRFILGDMTMDGLLDALKKMFVKLEFKAKSNQERALVKDRFTVADKMAQIRAFYEDADTIKFTDLFEDDYSKIEIITTFQAMLELMKGQYFRAEQHEVFGEILLHRIHEVNNYD